MKSFTRVATTRVATTIVATAAALIVGVGSASATLRPSPYTFGPTDRIQLAADDPLGTSLCNVTNIGGTLAEAGGSFSGTITGATIANCSGLIRSAVFLMPMRISGRLNSASNITLNASVAILIRNSIGGDCLYAGTLASTFAGPTSAFMLSATRLPLIMRLATSGIFGVCSNPMDLDLAFSLGGAVVG